MGAPRDSLDLRPLVLRAPWSVRIRFVFVIAQMGTDSPDLCYVGPQTKARARLDLRIGV